MTDIVNNKNYKDNDNEYNKKYYQKNKDKWNKKITCDTCGGIYSRNTKYNHFHSNKHLLCEKDKKIKEMETKLNIIKENLI